MVQTCSRPGTEAHRALAAVSSSSKLLGLILIFTSSRLSIITPSSAAWAGVTPPFPTCMTGLSLWAWALRNWRCFEVNIGSPAFQSILDGEVFYAPLPAVLPRHLGLPGRPAPHDAHGLRAYRRRRFRAVRCGPCGAGTSALARRPRQGRRRQQPREVLLRGGGQGHWEAPLLPGPRPHLRRVR